MAASDYEILDDRFRALIDEGNPVTHLADGCSWAEGPCWIAPLQTVVWSDVPNDVMYRWDQLTGKAAVFRQPSGEANGNTLDHDGRLVTCEGATRRLTRTEHDGSITVLADRFGGKRLNSPNDVVVRRDGSIWFTDPIYGFTSDRAIAKDEPMIGSNNVYRLDPKTGELTMVVDDFAQPNGLAFSPDEQKLYIVDTGATHAEDGPKHIRVFDVVDDRTLVGGEIFCTCTEGLFDGFRFDTDGRIWTSAGDGVHCYDPDGTLIGKIRLKEASANVVWGGAGLGRLFITATTSLYMVDLKVTGVGPWLPKR